MSGETIWSTFLLIACVLPIGCGVLSPPKPEPAKALLTKVPDEVPHKRVHNATLLILPPETSPAYDTTRMAYTVRPYEIGYFRDNEWGETPGQVFDELLVRTFLESRFFKAVLTASATEGASFRLQSTILELLQDHTVHPPMLRLAIRVQLYAAASQPIAEREIRRDQPLLEPTPYGGVTAANEATALALRDIAQFVLEAARRPVTRVGSIF